ncbi:MAG: queuosine precursor transporter [Candidatus Neomarinimicrobiota bacterium]|nr:queuosine precursor transporter [Candidatus Neomarinimicrobiota bacterium]MED5256802.1 queuosine precursor transporter [Candidatus Neomarinimicrobiota bacterium]
MKLQQYSQIIMGQDNTFKDQFYLVLAGIFIASLVTCNLIANKFVTVDLGFKVFIVSAGILPYPLTFLVTDLISELYGQKKANLVVFSGFIASLFVLLFLWLGGQFNSIPSSIVDDVTYNSVFRNAWRLIAASMVAYLIAQFIDVRIFHFWKKLTNGKHLWLRNNGSTIASQLVDTSLVICILFIGVWKPDQIISAIFDGWMFKMLMAFIDTPIIYGILYLLKGKIDIATYEER